MFTTRLMGHWVPLNWVSFGLDHAVWGMRPFGYHLTNVLLHAINSAVVYALASKLLLLSLPERFTSDRLRVRLGALVAALTFSLHPLRVESVAWVTERRDVLSGLFFLLAIWAYLRYCEARTAERGGGRWPYWAAVVLCGLALMSKVMAVSLPVILLLLDIYPLRRLGGGPRGWLGPAARAVLMEKLPFVALCAGASALALWAQLAGGSPVPLEALPWSGRLAILGYQLAFYLGKSLIPTNLAILYELRLPLELEPWRIVLSVATVAAVTAYAVALRRRVPGALIAWAAYVVILLPPSGIVQSGYQIAADRYSYLACLGWSMLAGGGVAAIGRVAALPAFLVIATLGGLTWTQAKVWHDNETVWRRAVYVDPRSGIARANLGAALGAHGRPGEAMAELREAIRLRPGYPDAHLSLGLMLAQGGDPAGAVPHFSEALRLWPRFAEAHNNLGAALAVQGRRDEALAHFREALRLNPDYAEARNNLGLALAQDGKLREAAE
ncbi:MAG TPA: tetratricopeptide repeat protein, partial [Methylomirabilota bacterium]|nr:tetratricopeptide repeat protein [Methylomirabilota bacterium]